MMKNRLIRLTVYLLWVACLAGAPTALLAQATTTTGPERGSLVIVGGGSVGDDILLKFIELAGGPEGPIVVIPTAAGEAAYDQDTGVAKAFRRLGAENVIVLHTDDPLEANRPSFTLPLENAGGVWFGGGRQWRLVDVYGDTRSEAAFWEVLQRGGVIGGSSAGATIQGSYLARGDTQNNQVMMGQINP
jgi:cyanophycinase